MREIGHSIDDADENVRDTWIDILQAVADASERITNIAQRMKHGTRTLLIEKFKKYLLRLHHIENETHVNRPYPQK